MTNPMSHHEVREALGAVIATIKDVVEATQDASMVMPLVQGMCKMLDEKGVTGADIVAWFKTPGVLATMATGGTTEVQVTGYGPPKDKAPLPADCATEHDAVCQGALLVGMVHGASHKPGNRALNAREVDFLGSLHRRLTSTPPHWLTVKQLVWLNKLARDYNLQPIDGSGKPFGELEQETEDNSFLFEQEA